MTTLKYTLAIDDSCNLTLVDTTGYYDVSTNTTGFLPEANTDSPVFGSYKLSQGYFINILLYNKFNVSPIISNATEGFYPVPQPSASTYADNFQDMIYALSLDGTYTMKRFFIISDVYYNAVKDSGIFTGHDVYYTDGTTITWVNGSTLVPTTIAVFLTSNLANATVLETDVSFISTCKLNSCYFKLMNIILDAKMNQCQGNDYDKLVQSKDLIYMTLETIKYMQDNNSLTQIQKLIEATDTCCSVCSGMLPLPGGSYVSRGGCGCG